MKHRRPYMLRYVAQIESANAHQKDFFEITFGETRLSENRKTWVVIEFGGKLYGTDGVPNILLTNSETANSNFIELLISDPFIQVLQVLLKNI